MTKITEAYRQWAALDREYETDEEGDAAAEARDPFLDVLTEEPATCLADVICKLKIVHRLEGWVDEREAIADAIACLERLAGGAL